MSEIIIKEDCGNYLYIYHEEYKIIEKQNGQLWNATEAEPIAVDKQRFENGDYAVSEEIIEEYISEEPATEEEVGE